MIRVLEWKASCSTMQLIWSDINLNLVRSTESAMLQLSGTTNCHPKVCQRFRSNTYCVARSRVTVNLIEQSGSIQATAFGEIGERLLGMSSIELYEHPHQVDLHARNAVLEHQTYTFKLSGKGYYKGLRNFSDVNLIDDNQHSEAPLLLPAPPTAPTDKTDATALPNVDPPIEKTDVCPIDKTDSTTLPNVDPPIDKTDMCDHSDASNDSDGPLLKKKKPAKSPKKTSN